MARSNVADVGETALVGWRAKVADGVAEPISKRTPLAVEHVRALIGGLFFALSVVYVAGTVKRALSR